MQPIIDQLLHALKLHLTQPCIAISKTVVEASDLLEFHYGFG
jgi:hypothetical protein